MTSMGCLRGTPRWPTPCAPVGNPLPGVSHPELRHVFGARDLDRPSSRASCWVVISSRCGLVPVGPGGGCKARFPALRPPARATDCAAATNDRPIGNRRNSDVCDKNTRRGGGSLAMTPQHPSTHPPENAKSQADGGCPLALHRPELHAGHLARARGADADCRGPHRLPGSRPGWASASTP
jgi:hypothetical protein